MSNHNILPWIADAIDNITLPHAEILRIKSLMDELCISLDRVARQSEVPLTPAINDLIRDLKHSSTYINGTPAQQYVVGSGKGGTPIITPTAPSHMDSAFSGQKAMKIENLYAHQPGNMHGYVDPLQALSKVNSVDLIKKTDFDPKGEEPRPTPGEVEAFVKQQEAHPETDEVRYNSIDEIVQLFGVDVDEAYKLNKRIHVEWAPSPVTLNKAITLSPIEHDTITTAVFIGVDYDTSELVLVLDGESNEVYRVDQNNLINFIGDLNIYSDEDFTAMCENIKTESRAKRRNKPESYTFTLHSLGENYALVNLNIDGSFSTFVASHAAVEANLKA